MRIGVRFGQESKCPCLTALISVDGFGLKAQACRYFEKSCFFGLTDYAIFLLVFEWDNRSVECGVFYCCWDYGDVQQSVCVVEVSCDYLLAVIENL